MYEPLGAWYHATKFAVEGLSDSLRLELKPHGIDVAIIEPAGTQSEWGAIAAQGLLASSGNGPYAAQAKVVAAALATTDNPATSARPELVAEAILHAATARRPKTRYRWAPAPGGSCCCATCCRTGRSTPSCGTSTSGSPGKAA